MLSDFGMCADVVVRTDSCKWIGSWLTTRIGSPPARTDFVSCGYSNEYKQGDLRLKKEPGDTNVSDALTKPLDEKRMTNSVDNDGLRVQRRAHSIGAAEAQ